MLKAFNALQVTAIFAAFPFGLAWVQGAAFYGHNVLFWVLTVVYVLLFGLVTAAVFTAIDKID